MKSVYLLTGMPGSGKTSLVKQVVATMRGRAGGFYTEEIRSQGIREGFRLVTLKGETAVLAHINIHSPYCVSKYGVDIQGLETLGVSSLQTAVQRRELVIVDEIGRMELFSSKFKSVVLEIFDSGVKVLGTIMLKPDPWADALKCKPQVQTITVTRSNQPEVLTRIDSWLKEAPN